MSAYKKKRDKIVEMIAFNRDDLGRTIISGLASDILDWHEKELAAEYNKPLQSKVKKGEKTLFEAIQTAKKNAGIENDQLAAKDGQTVFDVMKEAAELYATSQYNKALEDAKSRLKLISSVNCDLCKGSEWKECGCQIEGQNEGVKAAINELEKLKK